MKRVMTTIYLSPAQLRGLQRVVYELKAEISTITNSDIVRFGLDHVLATWDRPKQKKAILEAVRQKTRGEEVSKKSRRS